jgi:hypothetical protein
MGTVVTDMLLTPDEISEPPIDVADGNTQAFAWRNLPDKKRAPQRTLIFTKVNQRLFRAVTFLLLALHLAGAADSGGFFTRTLFRWLFKMTTQFHFAIHAFTLQFLLQCAQGLVNIVIAYHDLHKKRHSSRFGAEGRKSPQFCGKIDNSRTKYGNMIGALPPPFANIKCL